MKKSLKALLAVLGFMIGSQALANPCPPGNPPTNCAPPPGAILDLHGTPVPISYTQYSVSFTATAATTNLSFAFREDPAFLFLDDVVLTTGIGPNLPNLVVNGDFESGVVGQQAPVGWTYLNTFGVGAAGVVGGTAALAHSGSNYYVDGAIQGYDAITQAISTSVGTVYDLSFWLNDNGGLTTFSRLSTNGDITGTGGNGIDLLVYAGVVPTLVPVPEPGSLVLVGVGVLALVIARRRKPR